MSLDNHNMDQQLTRIVRESPDTYRTTFEVTGTAMVVVDKDTTILLANQEMAKLTGYTREEIEGKLKIKDFVLSGDLDQILAYHQLRREQVDEAPTRYSFKLTDRMGNQIDIMLNVRLIPGTQKSVASLIDVTESRKLETKLRESEEKFRSLFENSQEGIYQSTPGGRILLANPAFIKLIGCSSLEEVTQLNMSDLYQAEMTREQVISMVGRLDTYENVELNWKKKDGTPIVVRTSGRSKKDEAGEIIFYEAMVVDITAIKIAEAELKTDHQLFKDIINSLPDPTFAIDSEGMTIAWNRAIETMTCIKAKDILGKGNYEYSIPLYGERKPILIDYALSGEAPPPGRYTSLRREGESLVVESFAPLLRKGKGAFLWGSAAQLRDSQGNVIGAINTIKDFTEFRESQNQLEYLSMHDPLTGLYNRIYFDEEMARLNNKRFAPLTVVICDVDGLKLINDTLGHTKGDELLKAAALVIKEPFRTSDVVARIGGDEFAILLPQTNSDSAKLACRRIKKSLQDYNNSNPEFPLSLSIGSASGDVPIQDVFIEADDQMNRVKLKQSTLTKKHFVTTLTSVLSERDFFSQGHAERLQAMAKAMADKARLSARDKADLILLAKFHDIGKVAIPEKILYKPGYLTKKESIEIKRHCEIGFRIAQSSSDLNHIARYILHHHEWWNGDGYPLRLRGEAIPYLSRLFAVMDSYEAMTNARPHRKPFTNAKALQEIKLESGKKFQPEIVDMFLELLRENNTLRGGGYE